MLKQFLVVLLGVYCVLPNSAFGDTSSFPEPIAGSQDVSEAFKVFLLGDGQNNKVKVTHPHYSSKPKLFLPERMDIPHVDIDISLGSPFYRVATHLSWLSGPEGQAGPNALIVDRDQTLSEEYLKYFVIQKDGKAYIRFYLHPLDTHYEPILFKYLNEIGANYERGSELKGYNTASRSLVVYDPETGFAFSLKTNTNTTSQGDGKGELRPLPTRYAQAVREISDQFYKQKHRFKHLDIAWEPLSIGIPAIDLATSVRVMDPLNQNEEFHLSGFVYNDNEKAHEMAKKAGMSYQEFWEKAFYIKGQAMAELALIGGFWCGSNHAQNFRWVLDKNHQLLPKIVFLDISDGKPIAPIFEARGEHAFLERWKKVNSTSLNSNEPIKDKIQFTNFFRGDFGTAKSEHHQAMRNGLIARASELLGVSAKEIHEVLNKTQAISKNNTYGWHMSLKNKKKAAVRAAHSFIQQERYSGKTCSSLF